MCVDMGTSGLFEVAVMAIEPMSLTLGFEDVYRREYPGLVAVATALTGDLRDGEDAVQDTMVKRSCVGMTSVDWSGRGHGVIGCC